ncbi:MAG: ADP-ribosylglycohydrolase family protein, partial [Nocardioidaceae bacterium]
EHGMRSKGSRDLLGPSTTAAVAAIAAGQDPSTAGAGATTNGAAMRIAPVAIAVPPRPVDALLEAVYALSYVTHNSGIALSGAAAIAGGVAVGVDGGDMSDALGTALDLAERAATMGHWIAGASISGKTRWALRQSGGLDESRLADFLVDVVGTSVQAQESVVAALVVADRFRERPYDGLCFAARLGGDTDTIAAMAGAVLGAVHGPTAFPTDVVSKVTAVSGLDLEPVLTGLLDLRATARDDATAPTGH